MEALSTRCGVLAATRDAAEAVWLRAQALFCPADRAAASDVVWMACGLFVAGEAHNDAQTLPAALAAATGTAVLPFLDALVSFSRRAVEPSAGAGAASVAARAAALHRETAATAALRAAVEDWGRRAFPPSSDGAALLALTWALFLFLDLDASDGAEEAAIAALPRRRALALACVAFVYARARAWQPWRHAGLEVGAPDSPARDGDPGGALAAWRAARHVCRALAHSVDDGRVAGRAVLHGVLPCLPRLAALAPADGSAVGFFGPGAPLGGAESSLARLTQGLAAAYRAGVRARRGVDCLAVVAVNVAGGSAVALATAPSLSQPVPAAAAAWIAETQSWLPECMVASGLSTERCHDVTARAWALLMSAVAPHADLRSHATGSLFRCMVAVTLSEEEETAAAEPVGTPYAHALPLTGAPPVAVWAALALLPPVNRAQAARRAYAQRVLLRCWLWRSPGPGPAVPPTAWPAAVWPALRRLAQRRLAAWSRAVVAPRTGAAIGVRSASAAAAAVAATALARALRPATLSALLGGGSEGGHLDRVVACCMLASLLPGGGGGPGGGSSGSGSGRLAWDSAVAAVFHAYAGLPEADGDGWLPASGDLAAFYNQVFVPAVGDLSAGPAIDADGLEPSSRAGRLRVRRLAPAGVGAADASSTTRPTPLPPVFLRGAGGAMVPATPLGRAPPPPRFSGALRDVPAAGFWGKTPVPWPARLVRPPPET